MSFWDFLKNLFGGKKKSTTPSSGTTTNPPVSATTVVVNPLTLTTIPQPSFTPAGTGQGLDLTDISAFTLWNGYVNIWDQHRSQAHINDPDELQRGFTHYGWSKLQGGTLSDTLHRTQIVHFINVPAEIRNNPQPLPYGESRYYSNGDPFYTQFEPLSRFEDIIVRTPFSRLNISGVIFDHEVWAWKPDKTKLFKGNAQFPASPGLQIPDSQFESAYHREMANRHVLVMKLQKQDAVSAGVSDPILLTWGPYTAIESFFESDNYTFPNMYVNPPWKTADQNGEFWHDYSSHILAGMYFRIEDAGDGFCAKMYKNLHNLEVNLNFLPNKKIMNMVYLHQEGVAGHPFVPEYVSEYLPVFAVVLGCQGSYAWSEAGHIETDDNRSWNPYKTYVASWQRVAQLADFFDGGQPTFLRQQTEVSYDGGATFSRQNMRQLYDQKRPIVRAMTQGSKVAIAAVNPFATSDAQELKVIAKVNGQYYTVSMTGKRTTLLRS
ncbi:MAG: hypothetical protein U0Y10_21500 [Spirosomataceae bacterium]